MPHAYTRALARQLAHRTERLRRNLSAATPPSPLRVARASIVVEALAKRLARRGVDEVPGIRAALASAALALGAAAVITGDALAQPFAEPVVDPFGLRPDPRLDDDDTDVYLLTFVDIDGDGDLDAFAPRYGEEGVDFQENLGTATDPQFADRVRNPFGITEPEGSLYLFTAFGDVDGDGDFDLLATATYYGDVVESYDDAELGLYYAENTGSATSPSFAAPSRLPVESAGTSTQQWTFVDLDADGDLDLLANQLPEPGGQSPWLYLENTTDGAGAPTFAPEVRNPFGLGADTGDLIENTTFGDLDGDGDLDLLSFATRGEYGTGDLAVEFRFRENTGTANAPQFAAPTSAPFALATSEPNATIGFPQLVDIDADGDLDLFTYELPDEDENIELFSYYENLAGTVGIGRGAAPEPGLPLSPNPVSAVEVVRLGLDAPVRRVWVRDAVGHLVAEAANAVTVNTADLPGGLYLVEVETAEGLRRSGRLVRW